MVRSTTPTETFSVPIDTSLIEKLSIVFVQDNDIVLKKELKDVVLNEKEISVTLTQEETLAFKRGGLIIRLKVKTIDGKVFASQRIKTSVEDIEDSEVM